MHQNDRLQAPDTTAFERTVDQALNSPEVRSALSRTAGALNAEQLRSAAFDARDALAATAAAVFLLFGFGLHTVAAPSRLADELIAAGWTSAGVAVVATLTGLVWLLVAASRNRAAAEARTPDETDPAVVRAHEAWQLALLERAITPFLLGRIDRATGDGRPGGRPALPRPATAGVSGGGEPRPAPSDGPGYSSPDFAGPDFSSPDFGRPGFSGPTAPGAP